MSEHLAIDLGAESGRMIHGSLCNGRLKMKEIKRFPTKYLNISGNLHWNIYRFYEEIIDGLKIVANDKSFSISSLGIDTWGVDYVLLNETGKMIGLPYAYRDNRTQTAIENFSSIMDLDQVYKSTGIQILPFNTLFQLFTEKELNPKILKSATDLLFIPDILNYLLTDIKRTEFTYATTSQLFNPKKNNWELILFKALGINKNIMQIIVSPCTILGELSDGVGKQNGLNNIKVISVASHDTASAVAAIPAEGDHWAFISAGTWALVGFENPEPLINKFTRKFNFTNEGGINGFRILKNMMGFWILQECRRSWGEQDYSYEKLTVMAKNAKPFTFYIDPDDIIFLNPENMPDAITEFCCKTNQQVPEKKAEIVRGIFESLALKTNTILLEINEVRGHSINQIFITGGAVQNELFCQFVADATGMEVITVLAEGAAAGNILSQAIAMGNLSNLQEGRQVIRNSIEQFIYQPLEISKWEKAFHQFKAILNRKIN